MGRDGGLDRSNLPVQFIKEHLGGQLGLLVGPLAHRGQAHGLGEIVVVDAHHGQVLRHPDAEAGSFEDHAHGHLVRGTEDGGWLRPGLGPEAAEGGLAAADREVAPFVPFGPGGKTGRRHHVLERQDADAGNVEVQVCLVVAVQQRNIPVAQVDQVADGRGGSRIVVYPDVGAFLDVAADHHQGNVDFLQVLEFLMGQRHTQDQQRIDLLVDHGLAEEPFPVAAVPAQVEQGKVVVAGVQFPVRTLDGFGKEPPAHKRRQHPDGLGPAGGEARGRAGGHIAQVSSHFEDLLPRCR